MGGRGGFGVVGRLAPPGEPVGAGAGVCARPLLVVTEAEMVAAAITGNSILTSTGTFNMFKV
ncbi:MAG: hypothetical protein EBU88_02570 [Acidobacteria bacterium]|nr:hypothetical protein [Acidobacteriota bacterium]